MQLNTNLKQKFDDAETVPGHLPRDQNHPGLKLAIITNHPPPFRIPIYENISKTPGVDLHVVFCSKREPNRQWKLPPLRFKHTFLRERFVTRGDNFIHNNLDVFGVLRRLAPDVIVTTGFNPTFLYAFAYAMFSGALHVPMTDGTDVSEGALSKWHRLLRRMVYSKSQAFISASEGGIRLYASYGIKSDRCFKSCLCIDNDAYLIGPPHQHKQYDFIFCGRIVEGKNPLFALDVARKTAVKLQRKVSILFVGSGVQEDEVRRASARHAELVQARFNGFASQEELPRLYQSARIFLFPTLADVWGVVANEACAAGLPVIVSPHAGVAGELVLDGENGFVCPLDDERWSDHAVRLLNSPLLYERFSKRSRAIVGSYTFEQAAANIVAACHYAVLLGHSRSKRRSAGSLGLGWTATAPEE